MNIIFICTCSLLFGLKGDGNAQSSLDLPSCCNVESCETIAESKVFRAEGLSAFSAKLFDTSDFPARWHCGNWSLDLGWLHILSDIGIFAAYFTIPGVLLFFLLRKKDLPFPNVIWLFATFILACGFGHLVEAGIFWWPVYRFSGLVKCFTAIISWVTVLMLIRLMPLALQLPSAALLSKKLLKSQERLDIALQAAEIGVWELDFASDVMECDDRTQQIFAFPTKLNSTSQFLDKIHPEDREHVQEAIKKAVTGHNLFSVKFRVLRADGTPCYVQSHGKSDFGISEVNSERVQEKLVGVSFDITAKQVRDNALEKLVADRTAALQLVLDSTGDGLLSVDLNGTLLPERSRAITAWFGPIEPGEKVWDYLARDVQTKDALAMAVEQIADDVLPFEVAADQSPKSIIRDSRTYAIEFREIREQESLVRILVLVRDITSDLVAKRVESEMRQLHTLVGNLLKDREGFDRTLLECGSLISALSGLSDGAEVVARHNLHTLKGSCSAVGFQSVADYVHELEGRLVLESREPTTDEILGLDRFWHESVSKIGEYLKDTHKDEFALSMWEFSELKKHISQRANYELLEQFVNRWQEESTTVPLSRLAKQAGQIASRLGKKVEIIVNSNHLRLPESRFRRFWSTLIHIVSNSIDHGIESPNTRNQLGKPSVAKLELTTRMIAGTIEIEVSDDGFGIDWERVRAVALQYHLSNSNQADLIAAIFHDGVSTRDVATNVSGRGIGLSAVRSECEKAGGTVLVESRSGEGTRFRFQFPDSLDVPTDRTPTIIPLVTDQCSVPATHSI